MADTKKSGEQTADQAAADAFKNMTDLATQGQAMMAQWMNAFTQSATTDNGEDSGSARPSACSTRTRPLRKR